MSEDNVGKQSLKRKWSSDLLDYDNFKEPSTKRRDLKDDGKWEEEIYQPQIHLPEVEYSNLIVPNLNEEIDEDFWGKTLKIYVPKTNEVLTYEFDKHKWSTSELQSSIEGVTFNSRSASVTTEAPNGDIITLITGGDGSKDVF